MLKTGMEMQNLTKWIFSLAMDFSPVLGLGRVSSLQNISFSLEIISATVQKNMKKTISDLYCSCMLLIVIMLNQSIKSLRRAGNLNSQYHWFIPVNYQDFSPTLKREAFK